MWITLGITLFIVCVNHGETVGKYVFLCGNRKFCGFFIHIFIDFGNLLLNFPGLSCFTALFSLAYICLLYTSVMPIDNEHPFEASKLLAKTEGILTGISSGAALYAAIQLAKRPENEGKTIVALLPDSGDRYYSTPLFTEA